MNYIYVTPRQYSILRLVASSDALSIDEIANLLHLKREDIMRDLAELELKELIVTSRVRQRYHVLSEIGKLYLEKMFPEEAAYKALSKCPHQDIKSFLECAEKETQIPKSEVEVGLQYLIKEGCVLISKGAISAVIDDKCFELLKTVDKLKELLIAVQEGKPVPEDTITVLRKRKLVETRERTVVIVKPADNLRIYWSKDLIREKTLLTVVKPEHAPYLDQYIIKEFDLTVEPYAPYISRKHPFMQFIDDLRSILVSMGFEEVKGPHVESELWNFDVLFQAQDHPAREIHDTFFLKTPLRARPEWSLLERVKRVHEEGWRYEWSAERALRLVLRTQTTAVTARAIYQRGGGEYRVFTIDRNFRPENLDAKHSMEFYQLDGVMVGKNVNFKHLLYFFKELAAALGIKEVWFKPGYFPFTEPSVEGYIKHPKLGWIEVFPGGMFRPEVMKILGAEGYNAAAWGIGVDRLAMVILGLDDIRLLFTRDLRVLGGIKYKGLPYFTRKTSGKDVKVAEIPF
ncbi:MAG: phenylalanine--tRNA ligase subunit alpha [Desulfurococcaceae archaeon]